MALAMYAGESRGGLFPTVNVFDCAGIPRGSVRMFTGTAMYPEYLNDLNTLICPSASRAESPEALWDRGETLSPNWSPISGTTDNGTVEPCEIVEYPYMYFGWMVDTEALERHSANHGSLHALDDSLEALELDIEADPDVADDNWRLAEPVGLVDTFYRLREGVERFLITDVNNPAASSRASTSVGVMWDQVAKLALDSYNHIPGGANVLYLDGHVKFQKYGHEFEGEFPVNDAGFILRDESHGHRPHGHN